MLDSSSIGSGPSPIPSGSGSAPEELSSSIVAPPGLVPVAVAAFIMLVGLGQLQASTVSKIEPTSPGTILSAPLNKLKSSGNPKSTPPL